MSSVKRLPTTLDTEDLLKSIQENNTVLDVTPIENNDIFTFFSTFNLESGETPIKKNMLFSIYKAWSANPLSKSEFVSQVSNYIPTNNNYFKINQNALKLTYDVYSKFKVDNKKLTNKNWARHFEDFLNFHALEPGEYWIEFDIFFFLYDGYLYRRQIKKGLDKRYFEKYCNLYLKSKILSTGKVYGVTPNIQNFFQDGQLERMRKEYGKEKVKKVKKRKRKAPRSRQKI